MTSAVTTLPLDQETTIRLLQQRASRLTDQLDQETAARSCAEGEAADARELVRDLQLRIAWLEADRGRLLWAVRSKLLPWAVSGLAAGTTAGALVLLAWWWGG